MDDYYVEAWTIVEGALDAEDIFNDQWAAMEWLMTEAVQARDKGLQLEGYMLEHAHPRDWEWECYCAQYVTDHRPVLTSQDALD
jgi:hypothetical protein